MKLSAGLTVVALFALLPGCRSPDADRNTRVGGPDGERPRDPIVATFTCGSALVEARFTEGALRLEMDGRSYRLDQALAASGARYTGTTSSGLVEFWNKGREATLMIGGQAFPTCRETRNAPTAGGEVYIARGNEPGWLLRADDAQLVLEVDYGATRIEAAAPTRTPRPDGFTYTAATDRHQVVVEVRHDPCTAPSGTPLRDTVTVRVDERVLKGCGGGPLSEG